MVVLGFTSGIFLLMVALSNEATSQYINEAVAQARRVDQGQILHGQVTILGHKFATICFVVAMKTVTCKL